MAESTWFPAETHHLTMVGPVAAGNLLKFGQDLGQIFDAGIVAPPIGDPHVANAVYVTEAGVWMVSTGPAARESTSKSAPTVAAPAAPPPSSPPEKKSDKD